MPKIGEKTTVFGFQSRFQGLRHTDRGNQQGAESLYTRGLQRFLRAKKQ
jgi:hypothetical protein